MTGLVGSLSDTPLAQVIRRIVGDERSGDLQVTTPEAIKTVYFDRGFIVFASSNRKRDRLGESMVESGRISKREFDVASELMKASRVKFGKALVSSGIVSEEELGHYIAAQVNRIVLSLFSAKQGMYSFDERPSVIPMDIMVSLSAYRILLEGIRHMTSKSLVLAGLPSLDADLQVVDQPPFALDLDALRPAERGVLKALSHGPTTCRVIADRVGGNEGVVLRAVYGLFASGVLEQKARTTGPLLSIQMETGTFVLSDISQRVVEPPATVSPELQRRALEVTPTPSPAPPPSPSARREVARKAPASVSRTTAPTDESPAVDRGPAGFLDWLASVWSAVLSWLGLSRDAPDLGIAPAARPRPARPEGRPANKPEERAPKPAAPPPPERVGVPSWSVVDVDEEAEAAPAQPPAAPKEPEVPEWSVTDNPAAQFQDFFEDLGVPLGQTVDTESEPEPTARPRAEPQPQRLKVAPAPPAAPAPPPVVVSDSDFMVSDPDFPEDDAPSMFSPIPVEEVVSEEARIDLDVEDEVDLDLEIEVQLEPPDEPEPPAPVPRAVAPEPEPEPEVDLEPPRPPAPARRPESEPQQVRAEIPEPEEESVSAPALDLAREQARRRIAQSGGEGRLVRDVKLHFKLRDWEGAVPLIEQLVEISPGKALYRAMLGRALSRTASRRKEAEAHFVEALRLAPRDAEIHYWLGLYYKSFGLGSRAVNEFKTTLRIDPRHEGARRQLGVAGRPDDPLGSVLKKLFG